MIAPRMLSNEKEILETGSGLKNRVAECRKRVRLHRVHRSQLSSQLDERLLESVNEPAESPGYLKDGSTDRRLLFRELDRETSQPFMEQEVGIT
jgi:hypothetical protein